MIATRKVFPDVPMTGFKNNKTHLIRSLLPDLDEVGRPKLCGRKIYPSHLCEYMKNRCTFSKYFNEIHIFNQTYKWNSKMAVYLIECQLYGEQYTGSAKAKFRLRGITIKARRESL